MINFLLLGVSALSLIVLAVFTLSRVPLKTTKTLSWHVAKSPETILAGKICLSIAGLALIWWALLSGLSLLPQALVLVTAFCFILLGLVPYNAGQRRDRFHDVTAWVLVFSGMLLTATITIGGLYIATIALVAQVVLAAVFWLTKDRRFMLAGEVVYFVSFYGLLFSLQLI